MIPEWIKSVRSCIAFMMAWAFCWAFVFGLVKPELFIDVFKTVVIFYFVKNALGGQTNGGAK